MQHRVTARLYFEGNFQLQSLLAVQELQVFVINTKLEANQKIPNTNTRFFSVKHFFPPDNTASHILNAHC